MWSLIFTVLQKYWKSGAVVFLLIGAYGAGWKTNTIYTGYKESIELKIEKKVDTALDKMQQKAAQSLAQTQDILSKQKAEVIETKVPIIIEKKVYDNTCLEQDGVGVLSDLKEKSRITRGLSK